MQFHMKLIGDTQLPAGVCSPDDSMAVAQALLDYSPMENKNVLAGKSGSNVPHLGHLGAGQQRDFNNGGLVGSSNPASRNEPPLGQDDNV
jgi:hypothetical protein